MIKESVHEDIAFINIYAPNIEDSKYLSKY